MDMSVTEITEEEAVMTDDHAAYKKQSAGYLFIKRFFDILLSLVGLIVLSPVFLIIAIVIKLEDGGKVIFVQKRIGKDEKEFNMYKFRSMEMGAEENHKSLADKYGNESVTFKIKDDPRITKVGRILRKTSLDELPQLVNIIKGEMSIVGPRPLPVYEYKEERKRYGNLYTKRYSVPQGLTCYWQIDGRGEDMPFEERMEQDVKYSQKAGFITDFLIFIKTFGVVLTGKGAC